MNEDEYDLKKSIDKFGVLVPIIKDKDGNILDGIHRSQIDPSAPTHIIAVKDQTQAAMIRLIINLDRRKLTKPEKMLLLGEIANSFRDKNGTVDSQAIADALGKGQSWVWDNLPEQYKNPSKVAAGKASGVTRIVNRDSLLASDEQTIKIADTEVPHELRECDHCHLGHPEHEIKQWHGYKLCPNCHGRAEANPEIFDGTLRTRTKEKKGELPKPYVISTHAYREAQKHPQHSKEEIDLLKELSSRGITPQTDIPIPTEVTTPDGVYPDKKICYYVDGVPHKGNVLDRDERLRSILEQRGWTVLSFREGKPSEWADKIAETIGEVAKW